MGRGDFDRDAVEAACGRAVAEALARGPLRGGEPTLLESVSPGVVAFERMQTMGRDDLDWAACARAMADATGLAVLCVADCDWSFADRCDEEATYVAFDVPGVPADYAACPWRDKLDGPVRPAAIRGLAA